jgi:uncharacterized protein (TIGR02147 family)
MQNKEFLLFIKQEMTAKKMSLRKLAKKAQISPGKLSEIMNGKRVLTDYYINKLSRALKISARLKPATQTSPKTNRPDRRLSDDELHFIEDWYHIAILNLIKTKDAAADPKWISQRLRISNTEAEKAIRRLKSLGLIEEIEGKYIRLNSFLSTSSDIPSATIRKMHKQNMEKSIEALQKVPVEYRDISHITMAINPKNLALAKEEIRKFRKKMAGLLEQGEASEVYLMGIQLVPLTRL